MSKRRMCRLSWGSAIILFTGETESLWTQKHSFYYGKDLWQSYCKFFFLVSVAKHTFFSALEHLYNHLISRCTKVKSDHVTWGPFTNNRIDNFENRFFSHFHFRHQKRKFSFSTVPRVKILNNDSFKFTCESTKTEVLNTMKAFIINS